MRILILRSRRSSGEPSPEDPYTQRFSGVYAQRVVGNLIGDQGFCASCGPDCTACRRGYDRRFGRHIAAVIELPARLPYLLEDPARHVPRDIPPHDILLAINIHEQILLEMLTQCRQWGTRGVVAPIEVGDWVSGSARSQATEICRGLGVEVSFPKPFCDFDPPPDSVLGEFRRRFHIGKPEVTLTVADGRITRAHVEVSAACGATYYVARWLEGCRVDDDLKYEVVARRMHSYPCTASMKWDDELGDTILHVAGKAHDAILAPLGQVAQDAAEPEMVMSPVGIMLPKPVAARENVKNIEQAKRAILDALADGKSVSLQSLRRRRKITPAAAYSALLLLEQEGKVRNEGGNIVRV